MSIHDNPNESNRLLFQSSLRKQREDEARINGQFIPPSTSAAQLDYDYTRDLKDRIAAEDRKLHQWKFEPVPHSPTARLRESVAREAEEAAEQSRAAAARPAPPTRRDGLHASSAVQIAADLQDALDAQQLTADGVTQSILRECGLDQAHVPPPSITTAPHGLAAQAESLHRYAAYGEKFLACLRHAQPSEAIALECELMDIELGNAPPDAERGKLWAMVTASRRKSGMERYADAVRIHGVARLAVRAGHMAASDVTSVDEILHGLVVAQGVQS